LVYIIKDGYVFNIILHYTEFRVIKRLYVILFILEMSFLSCPWCVPGLILLILTLGHSHTSKLRSVLSLLGDKVQTFLCSVMCDTRISCSDDFSTANSHKTSLQLLMWGNDYVLSLLTLTYPIERVRIRRDSLGYFRIFDGVLKNSWSEDQNPKGLLHIHQ